MGPAAGNADPELIEEGEPVFTQCPDCLRQFRILAEQLTAADGEVKCGYCGSQFNALQTLRDQPLAPAGIAAASEADTETGSPGPAAAPGNKTPDDLEEPQFSLAVDAEEAGPAVPEPAAAGAAAEQTAAAGGTPAEVIHPPPPHYAFPGDYLEEQEQEPGPRSRLVWGLGCIGLMLLLVGQAGWFFRDRVLQQYPQLTPHVRQLCERLDCRVTRYQAIDGIRLVNRDVREHPRYANSLLVNATMINETAQHQPWPLIRLSLFDTQGQIIAWRQFRSQEYLDESIEQAAAMASNVPVHFVLEVTGSTEGAVSFEFDFLDG
ncbi:MAG: zinc-ribbon and DUF3426 domain-containing protein [Thiotrichales bacterium]|nr:zinc-ribbon and DUF3426 domain-containing protein [Thiotrichales bacterium]